MKYEPIKPDDGTHQTPQNLVNVKQEWISYLSRTASKINDLNESQKYQIGLTQIMNQQRLSGRQLYHMTLTYKPYCKIEYKSDLVNKFFINFYVKSFLPFLLQTRNIHTIHKKSIQPICFSFIDEHEMKPHISGSSIEFPLRLHHHAILAMHPDTMQRFSPLIGTNTLHYMGPQPNISKVMTSDIRECDEFRVLYASKKFSKYPDYLQFPNTFQRNRCSYKRLRKMNDDQRS